MARASAASNIGEKENDPSPQRAILVGFGRVGQALAERLLPLQAHGVPPSWSVVAIVDSNEAVVDPRGVDLREALLSKRSTGRLGGGGTCRWTVEETLEWVSAEVLIEASVSDPEKGEPGTRHVLSALHHGLHVVTCNKGPFALRYAEVLRAAQEAHREVRFGTTVGGVVPILRTLVDHLHGAQVISVKAVVNGTCQFLLGQMDAGVELEVALEEARRRGLTEPDPTSDLSGSDAASKAAILHNCLFSPPLEVTRISREALVPRLRARAMKAHKQGRRLISQVEIRPGTASVRMVEVLRNSPWALPGAMNHFEVETEEAGRISLEGLGAGPRETAQGLLGDLASLPHAPRRRGVDGPPLSEGAPWVRWPPNPHPIPPPRIPSHRARLEDL